MFWWGYRDEDGHAVGKSESFESRAAAESWLSQEHESLRERGIVGVELFSEEGGSAQPLYRMSLEPEVG